MIIQHSEFAPYQLPLTRSWVTHQGTFTQRRGWLIKLKSTDHQGIGDCAPLADAGTESEDEARVWLTQHLHQLNGETAEAALESLDSLKPPLAARCGIETALIDLLSKQQGCSMAQWLNPDASGTVRVNANMGRLDEKTIEQLPDTDGYSVIKLKVGIAPIEQELTWLHQLSAVLQEGIELRLDANRAWDVEQADRFISAMKSLPIESIEEPLANPTIEQLQQLQQQTTIPLALDESLTTFDLDKLWQKPPVKRITLKPMVVGGLLPGLKLAQQAYDAGMDVIVTTTVDSAVGVWAATSLAAALGKKGEIFAHGLATSQWLSDDVAEQPIIKQGMITLNNR